MMLSESFVCKIGMISIIFAVGFCLIPNMMVASFGHGIGSETLPPVLLGNRNVTLSISESQLTPNSTQSSKLVAIMLYETDSKKQVRDVTFHVTALKDGKILFEDTFKRNNGDLDINIITTDQDNVQIKEEFGADWLGQMVGSQSNFVLVTGPIFGSGGLYNFKVDVLTADSYSNKLSPPINYDIGLSIPDTSSYTVTDTQSNEQTIKIITYYDQVSGFVYTPKDKSISFNMPFDWSQKNVDQVPVVHEEVAIPKTFAQMLSPKYQVFVNGILLDEHSVIIDDYSAPQRLVHIIVNQNDLKRLSQQASEENAPLFTYTSNSKYGILFGYDPHPLTIGTNATFSIQITELPQNRTVSVPYDISFVYLGQELFRKHVVSSEDPESRIQWQIPSSVHGPVQLRLDNVGGNMYASAELPLAVSEEKQGVEFPLKLISFSPGSVLPGAYQVDLTWFPSNLQIDEGSEFVFTIRDLVTGKPVTNTHYEFVIEQNGKEVFRKPGFTSSGGDFVDYSFAKGQEGSYVIRLENIGNSTQQVNTVVSVTPEFPAGLAPILLVSFSAVFFVCRTWPIKNNKLS